MADFTIFYSWQMDAPVRINKDFIERALKEAVAELEGDLKDEFDIEAADRMTIEQGMKGVPGSPEVATMMFEKIGAAAIYVGDVTLVGKVIRGKRLLKKVPNPNVSIEEGFAAGVLGWERVICVANESFGASEEQAFDQRNRRFPISYRLANNATKAKRGEVFDDLKKALKSAIGTVSKYELRKAAQILEQLDMDSIELLMLYRNAEYFPQPPDVDPNAQIRVLRDRELWARAFVRLQDFRLIRTDLGVDEQQQARYAYHWTIAGKKVLDLIVKKTTPPLAPAPVPPPA